MYNELTLPNARSMMMANADENKHSRSRITLYFDWLTETERSWLRPSLKQYATYLTERGLAPTSANSYLSTIRGQYYRVLNSHEFRDSLYKQLPPDSSPADKKAVVDEIVRRIEIGISSKQSKVKEIVLQDESDTAHIRLTKAQADMLIASPGTDTLKGLRDTSIIAIGLCTGIRADELRSLDVGDLDHSLNGNPALLVREGKGGKQRLIPYGDLDWCVTIARFWMDSAGITDGAIFRPFWKGSKTLRDGRITTRSIERILERYPVSIDRTLQALEPHDLRRTYARLMYEDGMDVVAIQQNLGHANLKTTLDYIGVLDGDRRRAPAIYRFDLSSLKSIS